MARWKKSVWVLVACSVLLFGCGPEAPLRVGFIGGLSDRNSDNGQAGQHGVILAAEMPNESWPCVDFSDVVGNMLKGQPDGLLFVAGGIDVARLARQSRRQAPKLPISASEWAGTEQLSELGGKVVDGLVIVQNYKRDDDSPRFRAFREAYFKRYQKDPGYSSVSAYDAATVLRYGPYQGLQQIVFDAKAIRGARFF